LTKKELHTGPPATSRGVRIIAAFKLFEGLVLLAVGIGAVGLLHKDLAFEVERWADTSASIPTTAISTTCWKDF
jgi:predicted membrane protein DUF2127